MLSPTWAGIIQSSEGSSGAKMQRKCELCSLCLSRDRSLLPWDGRISDSLAVRLRQHFWFSGLQTQTRTCAIIHWNCEALNLNLHHWLSGSQTFGFWLNGTSSFSGSTDCIQQILGLLGLCNCVSQLP